LGSVRRRCRSDARRHSAGTHNGDQSALLCLRQNRTDFTTCASFGSAENRTGFIACALAAIKGLQKIHRG
jgi:hypothetical protein